MNQVEQQNLINSIKQDDLILFSAFVSGNEDLCFGRFPLLSLCYLYNAKKIIKQFNSVLIGVNSYTFMPEPLEVYNNFKNVAGRCLRLYTKPNVIVSPIEMLAIMHNDKLVKKHFKTFSSLQSVVNNLSSIYLIHKQKCEISETEIKIKQPKLTQHQKVPYKISLCVAVAVMLIMSGLLTLVNFTNGLGTSFSVSKIYTQSQLVNALLIGGNYELKNNINLNGANINATFNGSLNGNGYTIYVDEQNYNTLINVNNGVLENFNVEYGNVNKQINKSFSLLAGINNGTIKNVNLTCKTLNLTCEKTESDGLFVSMFAVNNNGTLSNCNLNLTANLVGVYDGDCYVSGFAGENNGTIENCNYLSGNLKTSEVDVSGIVSVNNLNAEVKNCKNKVEIFQTSSVVGWNPNVAGVVAVNYGQISNCANYGNLLVESTYNQSSTSTVLLGGIASTNYGNVYKCLSNGNLTANSNSLIVYCGGITGYTTTPSGQTTLPTISNCGSNAIINVSTVLDSAYAMVGGISGFMYGQAKNCYSTSNFTTGFNKDKYFVGTCLGACYADYYYLYDSWILYIGETSNNFMLYQENVTSQISAAITSVIEVLEITVTDSSILTLSSSQEIKETGVWWNE